MLDYPIDVENGRILVACAMKSGSTFIAKVLALYLGSERVEPVPYWGRLEQSLHEHLIAPHLGAPFVLQMHLKPHVSNVELIRRLGIRVVWVWRNLGDVIVSFDDHIRNEDYRNPVCYVHDRDRYLALPRQHRYRYLIDHALPWYLGFWLSWQRIRPELPLIETHYEDLADASFGYFAHLLERLGEPLDSSRLRGLLVEKMPGTRFNQGRNGRSVELLSEENKQRLEAALLEHFEDLAPLWLELPWRGRTGGARGSILAGLAGCRHNARAGTVRVGRDGLRLEVTGEDFYFEVPGALLAPAPGRATRLRLLARGEVGSVFSLYWRGPEEGFSERQVFHRPYRASRQASTVEFVLDESFSRRPLEFRLDCFNSIDGPGGAEILEAVKLDA